LRTAFSKDYSVITVATNKPSYLTLALNCAQSILLFNDIRIYIVTNLECVIPNYLSQNVQLIAVLPQHAELGIGIKLHLDEYVQTEHTIFIDSDCICFDSLDSMFQKCSGQDVTCVGRIVPAADWCGEEQAATIKKNWGLDQLIRFNGGFYSIKRSGLTLTIFNKAREIADKYDSYGFQRIQNKWINEEGPLSIAMMLNGQLPIEDNGLYLADLYTDNTPALNVLKGRRVLKNPPPGQIKHRSWYPVSYSPILLHFGGSQLNSLIYKSQAILLKVIRLNMPKAIVGFAINIFINPFSKISFWSVGLLRRLKTRF